MKKIVLGTMILSSFAMGQNLGKTPVLSATGGGNGGLLSQVSKEIVKNRMDEVALELMQFATSKAFETEFGHAITKEEFIETVNSMSVKLTEQKLVDKLGEVKDALNIPEKELVIFNTSSLDAQIN